MEPKSEILIYQTPEGATRIDVRLAGETVWLSQAQLAELLQTDRTSITKHIRNIYESGELDEASTCAKFAQVQQEGRRRVRREVLLYNLDMVISVGYRVHSHVATHFRRWATERLKEFIIKGFVLDDERLKQARNDFFDELLARIRDIRSSEKVFYRKVCDIFATSVDYDSDTDQSRLFFATVQNKFHYAIHGHTAAEVVLHRANAALPNMGLTNWPGPRIRSEDIAVAKNYLTPEELDHLNRIVAQYLEFGELQALNRKPMYMADWARKLDAFLALNDREVLAHAGTVSHAEAEAHALAQYRRYKAGLAATEPDELDLALKRLGPPPAKP